MALTHVSMRVGKLWQSISPSQALDIFPRGISASKQVFRCNLCGQCVTFAVGNKNVEHFRHNSKEENRFCAERTVYLLRQIQKKPSFVIQPERHDLPIRLTINNNNIRLEIGLINLPDEYSKKIKNSTITIDGTDNNLRPYKYSYNRLQESGTTFLDIGSAPAEAYNINISPQIPGIELYWPNKVEGISLYGCLFNAANGRKLANYSDVYIGEKYYLLCGKPINIINNTFCSDIKITKICETISMRSKWYVYEICADSHTQANKDFFDFINYNLCETPVSIDPIWPLCINNTNALSHNSDKLFFYTNDSQITAKLSPNSNIDKETTSNNSALITVYSQHLSQMLVTGKNGVVSEYYALNRKSLNLRGKQKLFEVKDSIGNSCEPGESSTLPPNKFLKFYSVVDSKLIVKENNNIVLIANIKSNNHYPIDKIRFGYSISLYQGLDCVWQINYKRAAKNTSDNYIAFIKQLNACKGKKIKIPHTFVNILRFFNNNNDVYIWLKTMIQKGWLKEDAYKLLKKKALKNAKKDY